MPLTHDLFIKTPYPFDPTYRTDAPAPLFRRRFTLNEVKPTTLSLCALGIGYCFINGKKAYDDLFISPFSDYTKTLWYTEYDVTHLLREGENVICMMCGNGYYNEPFKTPWDFNDAAWRDQPKFALTLTADGKAILASDENWRCTLDSPVRFNHLRSGEVFDARLYDEKWTDAAFDDSAWIHAAKDLTPPAGIFRLCACEPIREYETYPALSFVQNGENKYVFDIGQNISGYIRLKIRQNAGDEITIRYAEQLNADNSLKLNNMPRHYPESPFQTDRFICDGKEHIFSPRFAYHGFRYIEIEGLKNPSCDMVSGVFVHQAAKPRSSFECSDEMLNKLFRMGQYATLSNLFYMPTDCPTREKLGWMNDAQASAEQMLTDFEVERLFEKWMQDIFDAMREDGALPGIVPTAGWGFHWGNGPVSDGALFELPYRVYLHTGKGDLLIKALPYFRRYLDYLKAQEDPADRQLSIGLDDWARPNQVDGNGTPIKLINSVLRIKFLRIAALAERLAGNLENGMNLYEESLCRTEDYKEQWLNPDGTCKSDFMSAAALTIYYNLYDPDRLAPLAEQLKRQIEKHDFHHNCGMVGLRALYEALNKCGLEEYAYRIITAKGRPSYGEWLDGGATTLWEKWNDRESKNHHMYSDFMSWLMKTPGGIDHAEGGEGFTRVKIAPRFLSALSWCRAMQNTVRGKVTVEWVRSGDTANLIFTVPEGITAEFEGNEYTAGEYCFVLSA